MATKEKHRKRSRRSSHRKPDFARVDMWGWSKRIMAGLRW